jgi:hypothetical protein
MQLFFGAVSATVRPRSFFPPIRSREEPASGRRSASEITEADDERVAAAAIIELDTWPFDHALVSDFRPHPRRRHSRERGNPFSKAARKQMDSARAGMTSR